MKSLSTKDFSTRDLTQKILGLEQKTDIRLPEDQFVVMRLDGVQFSKLTKQYFKKPFDRSFTEMMISTTKELLAYFPTSILAYTQSDEMTIVLRPVNPEKRQTSLFSNRLQKLVSISAALASSTFSKLVAAKVGTFLTCLFDCRAFTIDTTPRALQEVFIWRQRCCISNSIHSIAFWTQCNRNVDKRQATNNLSGLNVRKQCQFLTNEYNTEVNTYEQAFTHGVLFVRREKRVPIEEVCSPEIIEKFKKHNQLVTRNIWEAHEQFLDFENNLELFEGVAYQ